MAVGLIGSMWARDERNVGARRRQHSVDQIEAALAGARGEQGDQIGDGLLLEAHVRLQRSA